MYSYIEQQTFKSVDMGHKEYLIISLILPQMGRTQPERSALAMILNCLKWSGSNSGDLESL